MKKQKILFKGIILLVLLFATGCNSSEFVQVNYSPQADEDWKTATPEELDFERTALDEFYSQASYCETIYGVLVIKDGFLIAEHYFNGSSPDRKERLQSVTKSFTSCLVGIALDQGLLLNTDQKMIEFFPEVAGRITDSRKNQISIKQMLEMRAGYPSEETNSALWEGLLSGHYPQLIEEFPLVSNPGARFHYSNLTSNWLGIIVSRQSGMSLKEFAEKNLFEELNIDAGSWGTDRDGHNNGCGDLFLTARDAAKFGQLYLDNGSCGEKQTVSSKWVSESLKTYSVNEAFQKRIGDFLNIGYGYHWWSADAGDFHVNFAWGHGGQLIVLVPEINMVIVTTAYPFWLENSGESWKNEKAIITLVSKFISSL